MGNNGFTDMENIFETLIKRERVPSTVRLVEDTVGSRSVICLDNVEKDNVILSVPGRLCLWANRDGTIEGLEGQSDVTWLEAGDLRIGYPDLLKGQGLTWDLRLAIALLEASLEKRSGGGFWDVYGFLLPAPHSLTMPICFPKDLTKEIQNDFMEKAAAQQHSRLESLFPSLIKPGYHPKFAVYQELGMTSAVPNALMWCFSMVRSRVFSASSDRFAFVPFLDMCNHWVEPNADYKYNEESNSFDLFALRPIARGDEVLISYGNALSNDDLFMRYGFVIPGNPVANSFLSMRKGKEKQSHKLGEQETNQLNSIQNTLLSLASLSVNSDEDRLEVTRLKSVLTALNKLLSEHESGDLKNAISQLRETILQTSRLEFITTLETDTDLLRRYREDKGVDARLLAAVEYRYDRKKQYRIAITALSTMLEILNTDS